jgi:hypothetical protein
MSQTEIHEGGCLCGAIRYRATGAPLRTGICHCRQCRRQTGSAMPAFATWARNNFTIIKGKPAGIRLSDFATREFCRDCGSPLFWRGDTGSTISVHLGSLDDAEAMPKPSYQLWTERRVHWVPEMPDITQHRQDAPPQG